MDPWVRRRRLVVAAVVCTLLILGATAAALLHRSSPERAPVRPDVVLVGPLGDGAALATPPAAPLDQLVDPELFARRVALALFDWDTTQIEARRKVVEALVAVGDPTGESTPGLAADIENYLPPSEAWADLQQYATRQRLEISSMRMPISWPQAEQAGPDGLLPGTTAYTIHGIRHRSGTWEGRAVSSQHDVAFTVFIVCAPSYDNCRLLRLSRPDAPLR